MSPQRRLAWDLNLLADAELAWHVAGEPSRFTPSARQRANCRMLGERLQADILSALPGYQHVFLEPYGDVPKGFAAGATGLAFAPTDLAVERLNRAGAPLHPDVAVGNPLLAAANTRALLTRVLADRGADLPGAAFTDDPTALQHLLTKRPPRHTGWLAKRAHGFAGRNRRRFTAAPDAAGHTWLEAGCGEGGVRLEPWLQVRMDLARHGWLDQDGSVIWGPWTVQDVDGSGAWLETLVPSTADAAMPPNLDEPAQQLCDDLAVAWHGLGYAGPIGIDAILHGIEGGALAGHLASDANARFTMGWFNGMARVLGSSLPGLAPD